MGGYYRNGWQIFDSSKEPHQRVLENRPRKGGFDDAAFHDGKDRLRFLLDGSTLLASSLDYSTTLTNVVRMAVPYLADWCFLHIREGDNFLNRSSWTDMYGHGGINETCELLEPRTYPAPPDSRARTELLATVPAEWLDSCAENTAEAGLLRSFRFQSAMRVPLESNGSYLGFLTFLSTERIYRPDDLSLASEVSRYSATAIENARRYASALSENAASGQASLGKDEVLAVLNHELRNLIAPILGWARVLQEHSAVQANVILAEGARSLNRNAAHMARIVDDCLEMSRATRGMTRLQLEVVDLNKIMLAAVEAVRESAWAKKHSLLMELSSGPLWIEADAARVQQVAMNLLVNAVKYTDPGGQLLVRSSPCEQHAEIEVADTGRGVDPANLPHIFEPFYQGDASNGSGLGLGLAISRHIVTLHQGRIWAESKGVGQGLSVRFRLPLTAQSEACATPTEVETAVRRPRRVLLVEDARDVRVLMKVQMESMGHDVSAVADPVTAIAFLRHRLPDIVISDIRMAHVDGFRFVRMLRSEPRTAALPVLAITGMGSRKDTERAQQAGFDACLCKPVEAEDLARWIDRLTSSRPKQ